MNAIRRLARRDVVAVLGCAIAAAGLTVSMTTPAQASCSEATDITQTQQRCSDYSSSDIDSEKTKYPNAVWTVVQICKDERRNGDGICFNPNVCTTASGTPGTRYTLYRDGAKVGTACLTAGEVKKVDEPPPVRVRVMEMFERLDWAASQLVVQPPGGRTLVNLDTNFYTENTGYTDIPVDMIEGRVIVSARPIEYRWNFGDGTSTITSSAGSPYPDLDVTHAYTQTEKVVVSVDTHYGDASFKVTGQPAEAIPSTIWVNGGEQDLAIVEAKPQLVVR